MTNTCKKNGKCLYGSFYQTGHSRGMYLCPWAYLNRNLQKWKRRDWKRIAYWRRMGHCKWCNIQIKGILWKERKKKRNKYLRGYLGGPVVRTLLFHCKGHGFYPWSGNKDLTCFGVSLPPPPRKSKWKAE